MYWSCRLASSISYQEKLLRTQEIREFLLSLPVANNSPMLNFDALVAELTMREAFLNKLKAFVRFMSKLNPAEYLRWMQKAFSQYVATPNTKESAPISRHIDESNHFNTDYEFEFTAAPKETKKAAKKKKRAAVIS